MTDNLPATIARRRLLHYSQRPEMMHPLVNRDQRAPYGDIAGYRPRGLWLSAEGDDDWKSWCLGEGFRLLNLRYTHEVILRPDANVLLLDTAEKVLAFNAKYLAGTAPHEILAAVDDAPTALALVKIPHSMRRRLFGLDWRRVAQDYHGIVIAPYQWELRLNDDVFWYYSWDCASGCIWNMTAIAEVKLTKERAVSEQQIRREIHARQRFNKRKSKKLYASIRKMREQIDS